MVWLINSEEYALYAWERGKLNDKHMGRGVLTSLNK